MGAWVVGKLHARAAAVRPPPATLVVTVHNKMYALSQPWSYRTTQDALRGLHEVYCITLPFLARYLLVTLVRRVSWRRRGERGLVRVLRFRRRFSFIRRPPPLDGVVVAAGNPIMVAM